jgi:hypothetical protein
VWSRALIHLIPKGHDVDMLLPSSYRPISLTSSVSKVFERVILCRLDCYAAKEDLFPAERLVLEKVFLLLNKRTYYVKSWTLANRTRRELRFSASLTSSLLSPLVGVKECGDVCTKQTFVAKYSA